MEYLFLSKTSPETFGPIQNVHEHSWFMPNGPWYSKSSMSFTDFLETETLGKTTYNKINFNHRSIDKTKVKFLWYISDQKKNSPN